ncbi:MAG: glycine cleavage system aminomethyltransferase GcvT [Clostridia bacterium]|nr:glycine cleavage system aminomethyltransferase GcvT [Clostridia bacterium]
MTGQKRTPLFDCYKDMARIVDFAGWDMPVQFEGIIQEHHSVRNKAGLFDVSHMGELEITGSEAELFLNTILTNDIKKLSDNKVQYTLLLNENAGIIDDILVYKYSKDKYWIIANASNKDKDLSWIKRQAKDFAVSVKDISSSIALLALQGPTASEILASIGCDTTTIKFFSFDSSLYINNKQCMVSRTGYTGEDGFEIYVNAGDAAGLWDFLLDKGKEYGLVPAGLGCRDTLRFEASLPLYGQELSEDTNPLEVGLTSFVALNKDNFIGKEALVKIKDKGIKRKLVGLEMIDRGIARTGYEVYYEGEKIGFVTSGNHSPSLSKSLAMALIDIKHSNLDSNVEVLIRKKMHKAKIVEMPFYKKKYKR